MSDLIERQDAIEHCKKRLYESALNNVGVMCMANNVFSEIADNRIETWLNELLSAEPNLQSNLQPTCNQLATDCISRQGAIDAVNELTKWYYETFHEKRPTAIAVIDKLMDLPSAEPEIIRCKDCKHYNAGYECLIEGYGIERNEDWFCADGERRDDE